MESHHQDYQTEILQLRSNHDIERYKNKLVSLYKQAFSEPPYFESFTDDEVLSIIKELTFNEGGICLSIVFKNEVVGLCGGYSLIHESEICDLLKIYDSSVFPEYIFYLAELAVDKRYRRYGLGTKMVNFCMQFVCELNSFKALLARTQAEGSNSFALFQKRQFEVISNMFQDVETCIDVEGQKKRAKQRRCFLKKCI